MFFVSLVVVGGIASRLLPLEQWPDVDVPFIFVQVPYAGSSPEEVERLIVRPLEEVLATMSGIQEMNSQSRPNEGNIFLQFEWGTDITIKSVTAREKIDGVRDQLPDDIQRINIFKFSTSDNAVLTLRVSSNRDLSDAYDLLDRNVKRPLERLDGVSRVQLYGVDPKEVRVDLLPDRIIAHGVNLGELAETLRQANFSVSAGLITAADQRLQVKPIGEFRTIEEIHDLVINQQGLRLGDVADIVYGTPERTYGRHLDQSYAVGVDVYKERGANLVAVAERAYAEVEKMADNPLLDGITLFSLDDQAESVRASLRDLGYAGLIGAFLSIMVLYFFIRNLPTTLVVTLSVPVSLMITLGFMYFLGISLNILSMMGLMLAVGMLVDNAVVVTENIFRERALHPGNPAKASADAVDQVAMAVTAGTLTTIIVFVPNIFGEQNNITIFLSHVAVAIVISLLASLVIAQTMIPLLVSRLPSPKTRDKKNVIDRLKERYVHALGWMIKHKWAAAAIMLASLASIVIPMGVVNTDMFPPDDTDRRLFLRYNIEGEHPLGKVEEQVDRIEDFLYGNQEEFEIVAIYSYFDLGRAESTILLTDASDATKSVKEIKDLIRDGVPKIAIGKPSFDQNRQGQGEGDGSVRVQLEGESSQQLVELSPDIIRILESIDGLVEVKSEATQGDQEIQVRVDRKRARQYGLDPSYVAQTVATAMRGVQLSQFRAADRETPMRLRFKDSENVTMEQLRNLSLQRDDGTLIPLAALADLEVARGPVHVRRTNRVTAVGITANLDDMTVEEAKEAIGAVMEQVALPDGVSWSYGRNFQFEDETGRIMMQNTLLAVACIYLVMAAVFESVLIPLGIIFSIIFSIVGVFWFFMMTGTTFSLMANIGILILIGVVVNNGIVLVDHINQLRRGGMLRNQAILQGGRDRLRPILMTVGTTVLGLIPLAVGTTKIGGGGPAYFPMARAIIGGLVFSTVMSLLFLPTIYVMFDDAKRWASGRLSFARNGRQKSKA